LKPVPITEPDEGCSPHDLLYAVAGLCESSKLEHDMVCSVLHKVLASLSVMTLTRDEYLQRSAHCFDIEMFLNPPQKEVH
jgi:hypothetical protein